jgi:CheY-like chemotaxis protein
MTIEEARILIVDDELELLEIFSAWLSRCGCRVFTAPNGAEALKILHAEKIDAMLSDIRMPIMDGLTLARTLNQMETPQPKILFVTGFGNISRREVYGLGAEALLEKPLSRPLLLNTIERCLLDSAERWSTPSPQPRSQSIAMEIESIEDTAVFTLGRGGCSIARTKPLSENQSVDLTLRFAREQLQLEAHGTVVWSDDKTSRSGIEFEFLSPECRKWLAQRIDTLTPRSFVPQS